MTSTSDGLSCLIIVTRPGRPSFVHMVGNTPAGFLAARAALKKLGGDSVLVRIKRTILPLAYDQDPVKDAQLNLWESQAEYEATRPELPLPWNAETMS